MSSVSLGTTVIPRRNGKKRLCRILGGKQGVLWGMWKWRIGHCLISRQKFEQLTGRRFLSEISTDKRVALWAKSIKKVFKIASVVGQK